MAEQSLELERNPSALQSPLYAFLALRRNDWCFMHSRAMVYVRPKLFFQRLAFVSKICAIHCNQFA